MYAEASDAKLSERLRRLAREAAARGEPLSGETVLAADLGVSRPALREELARIESEGLVRRRHGVGTIVNAGAFELAARFDQQVEFTEVLRGAGYVPTVELLEHGVVKLRPVEAEVLRVRAGDPAFRMVKRWLADGRPAMLAIDVVVLPDRRHDVPTEREALAGVFTVTRALHAQSVEWELVWPGATNASAKIAEQLALPRRAAVLTLDLVGVGGSGQRLYRATEHHVPGVVQSGFVRTVQG